MVAKTEVQPVSKWDPKIAGPMLESLHRLFGAEPPGGWRPLQVLKAADDIGLA
jgi:hypothetical protein